MGGNDYIDIDTLANFNVNFLHEGLLNGVVRDLGDKGSLGGLSNLDIVLIVHLLNFTSGRVEDLLDLVLQLGLFAVGRDSLAGFVLGVSKDLLDDVLLLLMSDLEQINLDLLVEVSDGVEASLNLLENSIDLRIRVDDRRGAMLGVKLGVVRVNDSDVTSVNLVGDLVGEVVKNNGLGKCTFLNRNSDGSCCQKACGESLHYAVFVF